MVKCQSCKKVVSNSDVICPHCEDNVDQKIRCPKCNSENCGVSYAEQSGRPPIHSASLAMRIFQSLGGLAGAIGCSLAAGAIIGLADDKDEIMYVCKDCNEKFHSK